MASQRVHTAQSERAPASGSARLAAPQAPRAFDGSAGDSRDILGLLGCADGATRQRLALGLQQSAGNAAVQRLVAPNAPVVQRWAVGIAPSEANCITVANYVSAHSPYKPKGWAKTKVDFGWSATPQYSTAEGKTTATVTAPAVTKTAAVDMPTWAPTDATMKKAWTTAMTELRAHEALHEGVADTWKANLTSNLSGLTVTVPKQTDAAFRAAVAPSWSGWVTQHQADQDALDPFTVTVDCAAASDESETSSADSAGAESATATAGDVTDRSDGGDGDDSTAVAAADSDREDEDQEAAA